MSPPLGGLAGELRLRVQFAVLMGHVPFIPFGVPDSVAGLSGDLVLRRRLADRRSSRRYDIVGELGGALDAAVRLPVRNIGVGGALLESLVPLVPASVHTVALSWNGVDVASTARVCHVLSAVSSNGERQYLIGVEFLSPAPLLTEQLARSVTAPEGSANGVVTVAVYSGPERRRTPRLSESPKCRRSPSVTRVHDR